MTPTAAIGEIDACEVLICGTRFLFISNTTRQYLKDRGALPTWKTGERK